MTEMFAEILQECLAEMERDRAEMNRLLDKLGPRSPADQARLDELTRKAVELARLIQRVTMADKETPGTA